MPAMPAAQERVWLALFHVGAELPDGWSLIGGQMVHLHCAERGVDPPRTTVDGDTVVDVRADRNNLRRFIEELQRLGFASVGVSAEGYEHRWVNGDAVIDVLVPTGLGERSQKVTGPTGSPTVSTAGGQQALDRSERVDVQVGGQSGQVRRPSLVGALIIKAAAMNAPSGDRTRHQIDFALLATMIRPSDDFMDLSHRDRQHLTRGIAAVQASPHAHQVSGWDIAMTRLVLAMRPEA